MAHNFRLTGTFYVSKAGSDANDGLTKDTPKASVNAALGLVNAVGQTVIIGTGVYEETIVKPGNSTIVRGDGNVKIKGNGSNIFTITSGGQQYYDITFENYASLNLTAANQVQRCWFMNIPTITGSIGGINNCVFINCSTPNNQGTAQLVANYSIFINCFIRFYGATNCYINAASTYRVANGVFAAHSYNNVMGTIINQTGTSYVDLAAFRADTNTNNASYQIGSFSLPPKFNNVYKYDFTLQYDSPHILAASDSLSNIGGTSYAKVSDMYIGPEWQIASGALYSTNNGTAITTNPANADIIYDGQDLVLAAGRTMGYVIPAPVKVAANAQVLQGVNLNGIGYYNKSAANGTLMNDNVPDADAYPASTTPAGTAGASPDRLSYGLRFTDNDTMPGSDIDWINGYNGPAGAFVLLEPFGKPLMNSNGIGNGSALYDPSIGVELSVIWVQPKITLTRLYA
jgi:hypothetical protein